MNKGEKSDKLLIGIDIIDIDRVKKAAERTPRFLTRVFTRRELAYCLSKKNPYPSLAARFAAKEAIRKTHPLFNSGIRYHDTEVIVNENGQPQLILHGKAREKFDEHFKQMALSLSHADKQAIAAVIIEEGIK
ncbi:MAG TPA: holo-ACP synthase [Syntrophomonadaceae bacterium]|nr:holo-ACP synthase [Syntrophomonadaceae bacterium]HPR94490.1 holo-ACP synthase [Syntrophomonadaceae bacterium]